MALTKADRQAIYTGEIVETSHYDQLEDRLYKTETYDAQPVLDINKRQKNDAPEIGKYRPDATGMVHVGRLHEGDVNRLFRMGYNVLAADPDERRRALVYIQENEPHLLLVNGKPFARKRNRWQ